MIKVSLIASFIFGFVASPGFARGLVNYSVLNQALMAAAHNYGDSHDQVKDLKLWLESSGAYADVENKTLQLNFQLDLESSAWSFHEAKINGYVQHVMEDNRAILQGKAEIKTDPVAFINYVVKRFKQKQCGYNREAHVDSENPEIALYAALCLRLKGQREAADFDDVVDLAQMFATIRIDAAQRVVMNMKHQKEDAESDAEMAKMSELAKQRRYRIRDMLTNQTETYLDQSGQVYAVRLRLNPDEILSVESFGNITSKFNYTAGQIILQRDGMIKMSFSAVRTELMGIYGAKLGMIVVPALRGLGEGNSSYLKQLKTFVELSEEVFAGFLFQTKIPDSVPPVIGEKPVEDDPEFQGR